MNSLQNKKILFATTPADGHFNPLTGLARHLKDSGCDVRWYTSSVYAERLQRLSVPHYPFQKALELNGRTLIELFPEIKTPDKVRRSMLYQKHFFAERSVEYYEDIKVIHDSFPFELVLSDSMFPGIPFVKHLLNIPVISIGVFPLPEDSVDTAPFKAALPPAEDEQTRQAYALLYKENEVVFKEAIDLFDKLLTDYKVPHQKSPFYNVLVRAANLYLQIGTPNFEYRRSDLGKNIRFIGALLPERPKAGANSWSDERLKQYKKIILVTQGTLESDATKILEPTITAFKNSDVLVVATTGGHRTDELRKKYPDGNIIIEDYIRFEEIMPYIDVYVTNGGYGGVLLSIDNKVPMVAAGLHEGKNEICARIHYFGCGIDLQTETPTPDQIYQAVNKVLASDSYKSNVARLRTELRSYDSFSLVDKYILQLLDSRAVKWMS